MDRNEGEEREREDTRQEGRGERGASTCALPAAASIPWGCFVACCLPRASPPPSARASGALIHLPSDTAAVSAPSDRPDLAGCRRADQRERLHAPMSG